MKKNKSISIVLFQNDLRIQDNPALYAAAQQGQVLPLFIFDESGAADLSMGPSARWWLHHALVDLDKSLHHRLLVYKGDRLTILKKLFKKYAVSNLFFNRNYEPWLIAKELEIVQELEVLGCKTTVFNGNLLWDPAQITKADGSAYKVFTPFYKRACKEVVAQVLPSLDTIDCVDVEHEQTVDSLALLQNNQVVDYFDQYWRPTQQQAEQMLDSFIDTRLSGYQVARDYPSKKGTSLLSAALRFGQISPRKVWWTIQDKGYDYAARTDIQCFLKELGWREFAYHVLFYHPDMIDMNLQPSFNHFAWQSNPEHLKAWQMGQTGYPIIDAGMRELYQTGYMHNRVRMLTASFLVKNLGIDWRKGAFWFWQWLVDADCASNSFNWQWVAGCGYDAAPYFRIFNPILQAKKFDKAGAYIKKYVPELAQLPEKYIVDPSFADQDLLERAGVVLGKNYPRPIINFAKSRSYALANYKKLRKNS